MNAEIKRLEVVSNTLNQGLVKARTKYSVKSDEVKALKVEIKQWRKELGEERKQKIKLENALAELEANLTESKETQQSSFTTKGILTSSTRSSDSSSLCTLTVMMSADHCLSSNPEEDCTICAEPIKNYEPEYFDGVEMNPACDNCKSPALETQIPSEQISNVATELHDNQNNFFPIEPTGLDSTNVNNSSLDFNIMNHPN